MAALIFLPSRIDDAVTSGMEKTKSVPGRTKRYTPTGRLTQNYTAAFPIHYYELTPGIKTAEQFLAIEDLWYVVHFAGPYAGFLVRDWSDYHLTQANSRLSLITGAIWQINRVHSYGGVDFLRPIYKPETGIVVKRTRAAVVSTATATVDTTNGQVTITGHVDGDTYTCEGVFDIPVTFFDDEWTASMQGPSKNLLSISGSIKLEEIRL